MTAFFPVFCLLSSVSCLLLFTSSFDISPSVDYVSYSILDIRDPNIATRDSSFKYPAPSRKNKTVMFNPSRSTKPWKGHCFPVFSLACSSLTGDVSTGTSTAGSLTANPPAAERHKVIKLTSENLGFHPVFSILSVLSMTLLSASLTIGNTFLNIVSILLIIYLLNIIWLEHL